MSINPIYVEGRNCRNCGKHQYRVAPYCDACWDAKNDASYKAYLVNEAYKAGISARVLDTLNVAEIENMLAGLDKQ